MSLSPCNWTSVGVLVEREERLLLIERRRFPYGFAPPAGHVDVGETFEQAAARELFEEVGLTATRLVPVLRASHHNQCRRLGGDHHRWAVYEATTIGEPVRSEDETRSLVWADHGTLHALAIGTRAYLAGQISEADWQRRPGLEPVWLDMLIGLGRITKVGLTADRES